LKDSRPAPPCAGTALPGAVPARLSPRPAAAVHRVHPAAPGGRYRCV